MLFTTELFDLNYSRLGHALALYAYPWQILPELAGHIRAVGASLPAERFERLNVPMLDAIRASGITRYRETAVIPHLEDPEAYPDLR